MTMENCTHCSVPKNELLTKPETAERLNVSGRMLERLIAQRAITTVRIGRHVRISESAISEYLAAHTTSAVGGAR